MTLSIVIPCYNESKNIYHLYEELSNVMKSITADMFGYELIFVNDGSNDDTCGTIQQLSEKDSHCKYINFSRNFGKESAMLAGLKYSSGDAAVIIDADLQHPPRLIPEMLKYYNNGYNQVIAQRDRTGDSKIKTIFAKNYYRLVNGLIDVKLTDGIGDFRLLSRKAIDAVLSLTEYNRFSKGLFSWIGFESICIKYENQGRAEGESKWGMRHLLNYGINGIISFNDKPLRLTFGIGLITTIVGIIYVLISLILIFIHGINLPGYFTTISAILILGGVQLLSIGVIGEYIGKIYFEVKRRPPYIIENTNIMK